MKKVLGLLLVVSVFILAGCEQGEDLVKDIQDLGGDITDLTGDITDVTGNLETLTEDLEEAQSSLTDALTANDNLTTDLDALEEIVAGMQAELDALTEENAALQAEVDVTTDKIKNALDRETWQQRKVKYNADWTSYEAEYCFGIFDEDWSTLATDDYSHNTGLKFVVTVEEIVWGTEMFVKDSCGNYSVFLYQSSPYALYSIPAGFFEVGKTYEVVMYKEMYFTTYQLGFLPLADMGDFGAYPEDLSGVVVTEIS